MVTNPATEESSKSIISEVDNGSQVGQREGDYGPARIVVNSNSHWKHLKGITAPTCSLRHR